MKINILSSAINDIISARLFYEPQREGLGDYFFNSIFSDIDSLIFFAGIHTKVFGFYRLLSKRFPFAIYYLIENNQVTVYRVLDLRKNPQKNNKILQQSRKKSAL